MNILQENHFIFETQKAKIKLTYLSLFHSKDNKNVLFLHANGYSAQTYLKLLKKFFTNNNTMFLLLIFVVIINPKIMINFRIGIFLEIKSWLLFNT